MSEREARETLRCVPCIFVRILDNPVCFSGCLNTTHVPAEQTFPWSCRGRRVRRWVSVATTREGSLEGALRFHPPRTVSSGAIRDDSRSSTRVPWLFLHVSHGCVCTTIVEANPRDGGSFSCTISLLNSVSFPYETHSASTYVSPSPPLAMIRLYFFVPFYEARCSRL